jgi:hypothetical protein
MLTTKSRSGPQEQQRYSANIYRQDLAFTTDYGRELQREVARSATYVSHNIAGI